MSYKLLTLIVICLIHYQNALSAVVGKSCIAESENGVCTLLKDCARALRELDEEEKLYTKCTPDYVGLDPIVCCLPTAAKETNPEEWKKLPESERKCLEYDRELYGTFVTTLTPNATPQRRHRCPFNVIPVVAGGTEAIEKEFPHMVLFGYAKSDDDQYDAEEYVWKCGGTLISELYVLTAAHCDEQEHTIVLALLGSLKIHDSYQKVIRGAEAVYDDEADEQYTYNPGRRFNDILLVKLNESVSFNEYILPACLPSAKFNIGTEFTATGWGATKPTTSRNNHLLKVELNEIANCTLRQFNETTQICAGSETEFKNTCTGDSGGPLVIRHKDTKNTPCMYTIVGITSYGNACFQSNKTRSAYTRVSAYVKWIECRVWNVTCNLL